MQRSHHVWLVLSLVILRAWGKIKHVVLFGDSYTDQSRQHSIGNGSYPGKNYQEIFPPADTAADGGYQWPWYLGNYGDFMIWNYAVGGAVCSNQLTPLYGYPDVIEGQPAWFIQDHVLTDGTLNIDPSEFVVDIFVGTNDVGINSFITGSQLPSTNLSDLAACQLQSIRNLYHLGARNFILNSLIPLQLTGLYSNSSAPTIYWPAEHDGDLWHSRSQKIVNTLNSLLKNGIGQLNREWQKDGKGGKVEYFDTYAFFEEMYNNPGRWFNGSIPADVVGHCHQCRNASDWRECGIGDCTLDQRDSYMWWDELHPSEQTGRNLAKEILKKILGRSKY